MATGFTPPPNTPPPGIVNITVHPGRYWVTAFGDKVDELNLFLQTANELQGVLVHTDVTEAIEETSDHPAGSFFIFTTPKDLQWPATLFGRPTVAGANINSLADTVQRPDPAPSSTQQAQDILDGITGGAGSALTTLFEIGAAVVVVLGIAKIVVNRKKG